MAEGAEVGEVEDVGEAVVLGLAGGAVCHASETHELGYCRARPSRYSQIWTAILCPAAIQNQKALKMDSRESGNDGSFALRGETVRLVRELIEIVAKCSAP